MESRWIDVNLPVDTHRPKLARGPVCIGVKTGQKLLLKGMGQLIRKGMCGSVDQVEGTQDWICDGRYLWRERTQSVLPRDVHGQW